MPELLTLKRIQAGFQPASSRASAREQARAALGSGLAVAASTSRALLQERHLHSVPVLDAVGGLLGVLTPSDLFQADGAGGTFAAIMTRDPVTVAASTPLTEGMAALATGHFRVVPVMAADGR